MSDRDDLTLGQFNEKRGYTPDGLYPVVDKVLSYRLTYTHDDRDDVKLIVCKSDLEIVYDLAQRWNEITHYVPREDDALLRIAEILGK